MSVDNQITSAPTSHSWRRGRKETLTHGQKYYDETGAVTVIGYPHSAQVEIERLNDELTCLSEALDAAQRKLSSMGCQPEQAADLSARTVERVHELLEVYAPGDFTLEMAATIASAALKGASND